MIGNKVVSIPLDVIKRETHRKVKTLNAQLKICRAAESNGESETLQLLAACEEGMFEARFSPSKLRKSKVKPEFSDEEWEKVTGFVFSVELLEETPVPHGYENVVLMGRLTSLENYDETGAIIEDDLSSEPPEFELSIRSNDLLSVEYGSMSLVYQDMEDLPEKDHSPMNLLTWILDMASQIDYVQKRLHERSRRLHEVEIVAAERGRAIEDMKSDYDVIMRDVEDRFFQVLQSKKRKIAELEGDKPEDFELLNLTYKERQKMNLKILKLEDIVISEEAKRFGVSGAKTPRKKTTRRRRRVSEENENEDFKDPSKRIKHEPKEENVGVQEDTEEIGASGNLYAGRDKLINESDVENDDSRHTDQPEIKVESQIMAKVSPSDPANSEVLADSHSGGSDDSGDSGSERAAELTDYSDSGDDAAVGHVSVSSAEDVALPTTSDAGNETEYSD